MKKIDGIYKKTIKILAEPKIQQGIKRGAVVMLVVNVLAWSLGSFFILRPEETLAILDTKHTTAFTSTTGFTSNFVDPTNAYTSNDQWATATNSKPRNKEYATNFRGFDFSAISDAATINSVTVHVEQHMSASNGVGQWRGSVWADVTSVGALGADVVGAIGPDLEYTYATTDTSDTDWSFPCTGTLPTVAQLKAANFGVRTEYAQGNNATLYTTYIDDIYIVVDYSDATIDISGTCDQYDQSADCVDDGANEIAVAVNGVLQGQTDATVDGAWTISGVTEPTDGDIVTVFINGEVTATERATAVTKWNTGDGNITGVALYQRHLTIGATTDKTITNTDLQDYDYSASTNDVDVIYDVTDATNDLLLDNLGSYTDETLVVLSGDTYQPDSGSSGNVDTHDLEINGTVTADGNTFNVEGSWDNNSVFTANTSTVTFDATSGAETIDSTGATTATFNTVNLGSGSGTATWTPASALDIGGALSIDYGTLIQDGTNDVNVDGTLTIGASGNFTKTTGSTLIFDSGTTQSFTSGGEDMGNIQVSTASTHVDIQDSLIADSVTIDGSATLDSNSNAIDVGGDWANSGSFLAGTGTVTFSADTGTKGINAGASAFNSVVINDSGGSATFTPIADMTVNADFTLTDGILDLQTMDPIMTFGDDAGTGNFTLNGGTITPSSTANFVLADAPTIFDDNVGITLGEVVIGLSPADTVLSSDLKANSITVNSTDVLYTCEYDLDAGNGGLQVDGTLDTSGDGHASCSSEADETYINTAAGFVLNSAATFVEDQSTVEFDNPSGTDNLTTQNSTQLYNLIINAAGTIQLQDDLIVTNDLTITAGTLDTVSGSNYPISVAGSWDNNATFTANSGTVTFDSADTGETIEAGSSSFYDVVFNNSGGGWIIQTDELTATDFTITDVSVWALAASRTITVTGIYTIANAETSSTTWNAGSKLFLNGTSQTIGSKTQNAEVYATLEIGANTDIRTWQSDATTEIVDATGSLYSQDHNNVDGDLYIWGDYHTQTDDHWSYATDFEGTAVTRQVDVLIDPSSKVTVDGSYTLASIGTGANRTTVSRQGASNGYELSVLSSGTINFQYTDFDWLDGQLGIDIQAGSTVTSLDYTAYDNLVGAGAADAYITVASTVIGSGTKTITGCQFDNTGTGADFNVNRTGSDDTGYWDFDTTTGTFDGEAFDGDDGANEADPGMLKWDDSVTNQDPNDPTSLTQGISSGQNDISESAWTNVNQPWLGFTVSDNDGGDTVKYRIQIDDTSSSFGSLILDYEHSTLSANPTTFAYQVGQAGGTYNVGSQSMSLSDSSTGYWWRVQGIDNSSATSGWSTFGVFATVDFKVDATAPTGGTIMDGPDGTDDDYNDGSLSALSAYWTSTTPDFNVAGSPATNIYEYAIGTTQGGNDVKDWTYTDSSGQDTYIDSASLALQTSQMYYFSVRAYDNAGNYATINSDGQKVLPQISFTINTSSITFDNLNSTNDWTNTKTGSFTTTTNAYSGYVVRIYTTDSFRSIAYPAVTIGDYTGDWDTPALWDDTCNTGGSSYCGFGYASNDDLVQSSNRFNVSGGVPANFAKFPQTSPGDIVADHDGPITGSGISNETFTITYKVSVDDTQTASEYQTYATYVIVPKF